MNKEYYCKRCGYNTNCKQSLLSHLTKKKRM